MRGNSPADNATKPDTSYSQYTQQEVRPLLALYLMGERLDQNHVA